MTVANPYLIYIDLRSSDGSTADWHQVARVEVFDVYNDVETEEGQSSFDPSKGSWTRVRMSNVAAFNPPREHPDLRFDVIDTEGNVYQTSVLRQIASGSTVHIIIGEGATVDPPISGSLRVFGRVHNSLDLPVEGIMVEAYHLTWTATGLSEVLLGQPTTSGPRGEYEILYAPPQSGPTSPCVTPEGQINLLVYAKELDLNQVEVTLATMGVLFDAAREQRADLSVNRAADSTDSEYKRLHDKLSPCLGVNEFARRATIALLSTRPEYLTFVAKSSGHDEILVRDYVNAWLIAVEIDAKFGMLDFPISVLRPPVSAEIMYALVRTGLGGSLGQLLEVRPDRLFDSLVEAIHGGLISAWLDSQLPSILEDWRKMLPMLMGADGADDAPWHGKLLALVFPDPADAVKREQVARASFDNIGEFSAFCDSLVPTLLTTTEAENLRFAFELYHAVGHFYPMVARIYSHKADSQWRTIQDLAAVTLSDWVSFADGAIPSDIPGTNETDQARVYGARLHDLFGGVSAQSRFSSALVQSAGSEDGRIELQPTATFLTNHPDFVLETSNIDQFIVGKPNPGADTLAQIKQVQRVYRLTSDFDAATALIDEDLDSALKIAQIDEDQFVIDNELKLGGLTAARNIHRTAAHYASELLFTVIKFHQNLNEVGGAISITPAGEFTSLTSTEGFRNDLGGTPELTGNPHRFPDWVTLFGDLNKCACKDCQTVLSPGAYFVDLLQFVERSFGRGLLERRPDLGDIELTCSNTNRMLPYIDLVNEVLEAAVVEATEQSPTWNLTRFLDTVETPLSSDDLDDAVEGNDTVVRQAFQDHNYVLGIPAVVKVSASTSLPAAEWLVEDDAWRFVIRSAGAGPGLAYTVLPIPQTSATNDSLEVFPEHFNVQAYEQLELAVFPFNLPLSLGKEEINIFLTQRNVRQHEILEAFTTADMATKLTDVSSALAYLNLTPSEASAILAQPLATWQYWGFAANQGSGNVQIQRPDQPTLRIQAPWVDLLSLVPVFLHRSGLDYQQLLDLLDTEFVHVQAGAEGRLHLASSANALLICDYNSFQIAHLNAPSLRRIGFFIRLWRKLGWTMRELDRYLMTLEGGNIPATFVRLAQVKRLCDELNSKPLTVIAWWRPMDIRRTERTRKSLFDEVFLIGAPSQPEYQKLEQLALTGTLIAVGPALPADHDYRSHVRAALKLKAKDLEPLWDNIIGSSSTLSLEQLTRMYRISTFCAAVGVAVSELDNLLLLTGVSPFLTDSTPSAPLADAILQTYQAIRELRRARSTRMSASEILYTLRHVSEAGAAFLPAEDDFAHTIKRLAETTADIATTFPDQPSPNAAVLGDALGKVMPTDRVVHALRILEDAPLPFVAPTAPTPPSEPVAPEQAAQYVLDLAQYEQELLAYQADQQYLLRYFAPFLPAIPNDLLDLLFVDSNSLAERYAHLWTALSSYLVDQARTTAAITVASELMSLDRDTTDTLLTRSLKSVLDPSKPALEDWKSFLEGGFQATEVADGAALLSQWRGALVIPQDGVYRFVVSLPEPTDVAVSLKLDGVTVGATAITVPAGVTQVTFNPISRKAGAVLEAELTCNYTQAPAAPASLLWRIDNADAAPLPAAASVPFNRDVYLKLFKAAQLTRGLALTKSELKYLTEHVTGVDDLSLNALPVAEDAAPVPWPFLASFLDLLGLNRTVSLKSSTLFELIGGSESVTLADVGVEIEWKEEDVGAVLTLWPTAEHPSLKSPTFWYVLRACSSIARRLDLRATQLVALLVGSPPSIAKANTLRNVYRSRFSRDTWKDAFKPLRDKLRQRQRDALAGYLTSRSVTLGAVNLSGESVPVKYDFITKDDLYGHFLLDVEMEPDTLISRIKLALSATQLFVERVYLGLEPSAGAVDPEKTKEQWAWMRNYRVWEANRKVFLYPENWIEPELRDDKTEFFQELETELLEDDITDDRGKRALENYLEKMNEVSSLEAVGMYSENVGSAPIDYILHVVARTRSQPRSFYYRTFRAKQSYDGDWTPWKKIALEIKADVVVPAVFNGRLYLFWPMVLTKQKPKPFPATDEKTPEPTVDGKNIYKERGQYQSEIRLLWSEYVAESNKWLKPRVSKGRAMDQNVPPPPDRDISQDGAQTEGYHLRIDDVSNELIAVALIKTNYPLQEGKIAPTQLGSFQVRHNGHDSFNGAHPKLSLGQNWPTGTILKHNAAEEVSYTVENDLSNDQLRFMGSASFLQRTPSEFRIFQTNFGYLEPAQHKPFFYETDTKSLFAFNRGHGAGDGFARDAVQIAHFQTFHHPLVRDLQNRLHTYGASAIMNRLTQALPVSENYYYNYDNNHASYHYNYYGSLYLGYHIAGDSMAWGNTQRKFELEYKPRLDTVAKPYALPTIEFAYGTSFGVYNWELFFHVPMLIGERLSQDLKFEEAMAWYHYVFDPKQDLNTYEKTKRWAYDLPTGSRYWNFLPFFANKKAKDSLEDVLGIRKTLSTYERNNLSALIDEWRHHPFNPHLIARQRIAAYQKFVVMKYLDNLLSWGDQLFRQDTFEAINQATQLYILASQILGQRPQQVEPLARETRHTYRELRDRGIDAFSNALVEVEYLLMSNRAYLKELNVGPQSSGAKAVQNLALQTAYFQVPRNERLDSYWDTVQDRLFKIRNSMNIDGIKRQLALFEPPIDPALLVRAAAAGLDLSSVLSQLNTSLPRYRFAVWIQKAVDLCNELRGFGGALLAALEKKDGEDLQLLRQSHEIKMLELMQKVREKQIEDAEENITALELSRALAEERLEYYRTREKVSGTEKAQISQTASAGDTDTAQGAIHSLASFFAPIPDAQGGAVGPLPLGASAFKIGSALYHGAEAGAAAVGTAAGYLRSQAALSGLNAGYERRWDDWKLQERLASKEIDQLNQQITGARIRLAIAEQELTNSETQVEHAQEVGEFLRDKFTNRELYQKMASQLSTTYQQVYKLAYDIAKTAERTFQFELGVDDARFIQFGYMDSLKMGLLAGDKLIHDLKRMDIAYLERNKREFEIQKSISLALVDGRALEELRETGACNFELPEVLFDLDFPGQYFRRIKAVRLTIPCVTGPHTSVSAKLTLLGSAIRKQSTADPSAYPYEGFDDPRFVHDLVGIQSIATSSAQSDAGLFELNFRDERYLPFEGAGAISRWRLELPTAMRQFDYDTISDVVVQLSYTSRDGGGLLKQGAEQSILDGLNHIASLVVSDQDPEGLVRVFSLRKEFPDVFHQLLSLTNGTDTVPMTLLPEHFPFILRQARLNMALTDDTGYVDCRILLEPGAELDEAATVSLTAPEQEKSEETLGAANADGVIVTSLVRGTEPLLGGWAPEIWRLGQTHLTSGTIHDVIFVVRYTVEAGN